MHLEQHSPSSCTSLKPWYRIKINQILLNPYTFMIERQILTGPLTIPCYMPFFSQFTKHACQYLHTGQIRTQGRPLHIATVTHRVVEHHMCNRLLRIRFGKQSGKCSFWACKTNFHRHLEWCKPSSQGEVGRPAATTSVPECRGSGFESWSFSVRIGQHWIFFL